ncbi:4,5-epoxidase [Nocardiopsis arvandica]|uniref:4,5-epoxidase n=1 Tax=Nocardiopsis sinuspersici TaxID=501010 RepID=A0A7Y9XGV9_9ACTN|nr:FAD-dependent monooxygenase [Nocardiopsis sinuspersici]NYH55599.1 4,5-epoxidase [Nocardiopsis sinuspersici]
MNTDTTEVLVVGAGPTGLALACGLRMGGAAVRVVDRAAKPATTSRANILHARGAEVLDRLGALGDLPRRGRSALKMTSYLGGRAALTMRFGDVGLETARPAIYISQAEIEAALRRRLAELGGDLTWDTALTGLSQDGHGVTAQLGDGTRIRAHWLAGCDGAHSTVRSLSDVDFPGVAVTERFLLADVHADWPLDRAGGHGWPHAEGPFFAMPMPGHGDAHDRWRLMVYDPEGEGDLGPAEILDRFRHLAPRRTGRNDLPIRDAVWTSVFRVHRRLATSYRRGRVLLLGDAAHVHSPLGGQGMVTGMGDAENLAWKLGLVLRERAAPALLDTYQDERRPLAVEVLRGTTTATRVQTGRGPLTRFLRERVLIPLVNLPPVQRRFTQVASQLWVTYRRDPLSGGITSRFGRRPRPGDRVPDLSCGRLDGVRTRLHAELGGRWALLVPPSGAEAYVEAARTSLGDGVVALTADHHPRDDVWLVRPDAHLAWRGRGGTDGLRRWLETALGQGRARPRRWSSPAGGGEDPLSR